MVGSELADIIIKQVDFARQPAPAARAQTTPDPVAAERLTEHARSPLRLRSGTAQPMSRRRKLSAAPARDGQLARRPAQPSRRGISLLTTPRATPMLDIAFCAVRHGERFFSLQERTREPPLADGCARPRVGKPDAVNSVAPPLRNVGAQNSLRTAEVEGT